MNWEIVGLSKVDFWLPTIWIPFNHVYGPLCVKCRISWLGKSKESETTSFSHSSNKHVTWTVKCSHLGLWILRQLGKKTGIIDIIFQKEGCKSKGSSSGGGCTKSLTGLTYQFVFFDAKSLILMYCSSLILHFFQGFCELPNLPVTFLCLSSWRILSLLATKSLTVYFFFLIYFF